MNLVRQPRVAVIGLGAQGLVTVKNLLEENFAVTGFERHASIGGIWHYTAEDRLSALPSTTVNVSHQRACFTDFPFTNHDGSFPNSAAMDHYLNSYADRFSLWPHLRLETTVEAIVYEEEQKLWSITIRSKDKKRRETLLFDKLVVAIGPHAKPIWPEIDGRDLFAGSLSHAISFKDPKAFTGKRVVVIGASNTAADTCAALVGAASEIYFAHRHGAIVLPRILKDGSALDHQITWRHNIINEWLWDNIPTVAQMLGDAFISHLSRSEYGTLDPLWRITPTPSLAHQVPTVTDTLVPHLRSGRVISCQVPSRIIGPNTVQLQDGSKIEVDAIICCTGYSPDFSLLGLFDPTLNADNSREYNTPHLYQNIFSLQQPQSLAFIGYALMSQPAALLADLSSMAVAQLWSNKPNTPSLPNSGVMYEWYREHLRWVQSIQALSPHGKFVKLSVQSGPWMEWIEQTIGSHVSEHLSYLTLQGWKFWLTDRRLCNLMMGGIWSPHFYRLFDGDGRRKWTGAREAIMYVNRKLNATIQAGLQEK